MTVIDPDLLAEFRAARCCSWCGHAMPYGCDAAHVFARGLGGGSRLDIRYNLVALCRPCHNAHHAGERPLRCDLTAIVAAREGCSQDDVVDTIHALLRAPKGSVA